MEKSKLSYFFKIKNKQYHTTRENGGRGGRVSPRSRNFQLY